MALSWIGMIAGGSACGGAVRALERPRVEVTWGAVEPEAAGGLSIRIELEVAGDDALSLAAVDWELSVGDRVMTRGRSEPSLRVEPRRAARETLLLRVKPGAAAKVLALREAEGGDYRVDGVLHWRAAGGEVATAFTWPASAGQ